jgi:TolA-binding protein
MAKSSADKQLGIVRSAAVISLGLVALAGSIAASLYRRMTAPAGSSAAAPRVSQLVMDEWDAELGRLNLPSRSDVQAMQRQLAELEAQIDQLIQMKADSPPKEGE